MASKDPIADFKRMVNGGSCGGSVYLRLSTSDAVAVVAELTRLRTQLAEAEAERERLTLAMIGSNLPTFVKGVDPAVMLDEERKVRAELLAESERLRESAEALLAEVASSSTSPDRDGPGCWWCIADAGQPHEPGCKYAALSASGVEVLARGWWYNTTETMPDSWQIGLVTDPQAPPAKNMGVPCIVIRTNLETTDAP